MSRVLSIALALYSVAVFASLAAALGAYFIRPNGVDDRPEG